MKRLISMVAVALMLLVACDKDEDFVCRVVDSEGWKLRILLR